MGNDELDEIQVQDTKSPRSPPTVSIVHFDENRNKKQNPETNNNNCPKTTRFSFDKTDISIISTSTSPRIFRSKTPSSADEHTPKRQPWLTRKSADWGPTPSVRQNGTAGHRRTEVMIVIMGASRVGKSAIVNQFLHNIFPHEYAATVDELHWIEYDATNYSTPHQDPNQSDHNTTTNPTSQTLLLKIMDASGSHDFIGMRKLYEQQGDAFILVISIDDANSFEEAKIIRQEIAERNNKKAPVICVLNKIDLKMKFGNSVKAEDVHEFASLNNCLYVEVTASEHESVAEIFKRLLQQNTNIPSAAQLKYRRKSVPISMQTSDFEFPLKKVHKELANKKCLKAINEGNGTGEDEKRNSACVIC